MLDTPIPEIPIPQEIPIKETTVPSSSAARDSNCAMSRQSFLVGAFLGIPFLLAGCARTSTSASAPPSPPPVEVEVAKVVSQPLIEYREFTGRTAAIHAVEIRARVSGYLRENPQSVGGGNPNLDADATPTANPDGTPQPEVVVKEGDQIEEGTLLFVVDPRPYELALQQGTGNLKAAEARLKQANQELSRFIGLREDNAIAQAEYEQAVASVADLQGQIENLRATVARSQLDLEFTRVRSPISGLLGRTLVTRGNLVVADTTILTTVVSTAPIYVDFDVDEQSVLEYRSRMRAGQVESARETRIPIKLGLANESGYPHSGVIDFVNNITDPNTGNTRVRGTFENRDGVLSPGLFARIRAPFSGEYQALLVPTKSIGMDQQGRYVMVVANNRVERRGVVTGEIVGGMTAIRSGIAADDTVVTAGLQKIRPGAEVRIARQDAAGDVQ